MKHYWLSPSSVKSPERILLQSDDLCGLVSTPTPHSAELTHTFDNVFWRGNIFQLMCNSHVIIHSAWFLSYSLFDRFWKCKITWLFRSCGQTVLTFFWSDHKHTETGECMNWFENSVSGLLMFKCEPEYVSQLCFLERVYLRLMSSRWFGPHQTVTNKWETNAQQKPPVQLPATVQCAGFLKVAVIKCLECVGVSEGSPPPFFLCLSFLSHLFSNDFLRVFGVFPL